MGSLAMIATVGPKGVYALDAAALDALGIDDMAPEDRLLPWSVFHAGTTATPAALDLQPLELKSLEVESPRPRPSPRTTLRFTLSEFSFQLPLFDINDSSYLLHKSSASGCDPPSQNTNSPSNATAVAAAAFAPQADLDFNLGLDHDLDHDPDADTDADDRLPPAYTFYLSPSSSSSSLASAAWSTTSCPSRETQATMPGPTPAALDSRTAADTSHWLPRPHSAQSERSARSPSPILTRWARRHQQHHSRPSHSKLDGSGRSSIESKTISIGLPSSRSRSSSIQKRPSQHGVVPQMTREEFEALPLAIQRKYFSTLERLRFARDSGLVDNISHHYDDISNHKRRKPRQERSVSEHLLSSRVRRRSLLESRFSTDLSSPSFRTRPNNKKAREYTREEQVVLARRLRASVILDAADEAIYKLNRRMSKNLRPAVEPIAPSLSSRRSSMDSHGALRCPPSQTTSTDAPQSFYDSFRWLEEEEDLDLRLFLDDYHSNLREDLPCPKTQQRPSFRRHLSISRIPFGRNSISLSRPATKDASSPTSPAYSSGEMAGNPAGHTRRKSRTLSLITPKHAPQDSLSAFDPAAAHYQDPEARLKLRVYLASPQKFDEAIEFGFPSTDPPSAPHESSKESKVFRRRQSRQQLAAVSPNTQTFLVDDDDEDDDEELSLSSDQPSMADPESPKTPQAIENKAGAHGIRPLRVGATDAAHAKDAGSHALEASGYAHAPASSREMTLRMTLTRPDLRAHEDQIYGWRQMSGHQQPGRKSTTMAPLGMDGNVTYIGDMSHKQSMEKVSAVLDQWSTSTTDKGVMKRIWNRVRRA
ncbi:hypothetical protein B0T19DRAFT_438126 [Cercophora scortea]|uniref:Mucin n=1 Tax=Cercophora scortea TaxID=314031 RepID=A0AAE0J742_9PEZI|nr:hypothetical protein B0T19DRAFT_438126 [Cercophora scortea]